MAAQFRSVRQLQPIVVRMAGDKVQILMGEHRWRGMHLVAHRGDVRQDHRLREVADGPAHPHHGHRSSSRPGRSRRTSPGTCRSSRRRTRSWPSPGV
ncbi:ParB/Srx family N-terminal domain-containing protein [Streptomyces thermolilacinus]